MKVLLHSDKQDQIAKSGVGRAIVHQQEALRLNGVDYTLDPKDTDYDIVHINTIFPESYLMGKKAKKMGKKVIFHAHSTEEDFRNSYLLTNQVAPLFKKWLCKLYSSADLIITPTPYSKRLLDNYGLGKPIIAEPGSVCTFTYIVAGVFNDRESAENYANYIKTQFYRFLVSLRKNTQHSSSKVFSFVPDLPMTQKWTDEMLFDRYNITPDEQEYIKSMVKEIN